MFRVIGAVVVVALSACSGGQPSGGDGGPTTDGSASDGGGTHGTGGGSSSRGDGGVTQPVSLQDLCAQFPQASCEHQARCNAYETASSSACLLEARNTIAFLCVEADAGAVTFDGQLARACLDELGASPLACAFSGVCSMLGTAPVPTVTSPLRTVFRARARGCGAATCQQGQTCDESCTGATCQPYTPLGAPCDSPTAHPAHACDPLTSWCGSSGPGGALTCLPYAAAGERCDNGPCAQGTFCGRAGSAYVCKPVLDAGSPCSPSDVCDDGTCRSSGVCGALPAGAACTASLDCSARVTGNICVGLVLERDGGVVAPGSCAARPTLGERCSLDWASNPCHPELNQACLDGTCQELAAYVLPSGAECPLRSYSLTQTPFYGYASCQRGLACLSDATAHPPFTGRCAAPLLEGALCTNERSSCTPGTDCEPAADGGARCRTPPRAGEPCTTTCRADAFCTAGHVCQLLGEADAGCTSLLECRRGLNCSLDHCVVTEGCNFDYQCLGGFCQAGLCVAACRL